MMVLQRAVVFIALCAPGCVSPAAQVSARPMYGGDAGGKACIESLPSLDVADSEITSEMRVARLLSAESLALADPAPPVSTSAQDVQLWSDSVLKSWVQAKHRRAEAARAELDRAALQNHRQRIMAGALVGLVYEDVARVLMSVPVPDDLRSEPEIAEMFKDVIAAQALPYLTQAKRAYEACAKNAVEPETMGHWTPFCQGRADHLPHVGKGSDQDKTEATTDVTVVSR